MHAEVLFVLLFSIATAVALLARRLRVPYSVALVVAGAGLGSLHAFEAPHLTKELLFALFLPGLLYEAAFHLKYDKVRQSAGAIVALAVPGVVASLALTGLLLTEVVRALHLSPDFGPGDGLVFGALIAATDPIAVVSLFKTLGAPRRLAVLVEGESLLNDGTSVVLFTIILAAVQGGGLHVGAGVLSFVRVVGVGIAVGGLVGYAASKVIQQVDEAMIEITVTTISAYGSFVAAEQLGASGVIATVTAGMICGNYGASTGMSPSTRIAAETFWEYVAFALNSVVFLLIGFEVRVDALLASWLPIVVAWVAVTVARAVVTYAVSSLLRPTRESMPWSWPAVLTWGGLRGGLSMVLVLALPETFPHRELLVNMTFGVVVLSILVQGLTMAPLLRRLGVVRESEDRKAYEAKRAALIAARAAASAIEQMKRAEVADPDILDQLRREYGRRIDAVEEAIRCFHVERESIREEELIRARRFALLAEKDAILRAGREGALGDGTVAAALADVDARLVALAEGGVEDGPGAPASSAQQTRAVEDTADGGA